MNTVLFLSEYYSAEVAAEALPGAEIINDMMVPLDITWVYADGKYLQNRRSYDVPALLKPPLDDATLRNKTSLHVLLSKKLPSAICDTIIINDTLSHNDHALPSVDAPLIVKTSWGHAGMGNMVVDSDIGLAVAVRIFSKYAKARPHRATDAKVRAAAAALGVDRLDYIFNVDMSSEELSTLHLPKCTQQHILWSKTGMICLMADGALGPRHTIYFYRDHKDSIPRTSIPPVIMANKYITNPMLYKVSSGALHKFHLRLYVIIMVRSDGTKSAWLKNTGLIVPAAAPFILGDYYDTAIHDTHVDHAPELGTYPEDLRRCGVTDIHSAAGRVHGMLADVMTISLPHVTKFPEAINAYRLYGIDVMLLDDGTPILLEFNRFPGYTFDTRTSTHELLSSLIETVYNDVIGASGALKLTTLLV
jgi:hypothetical protein